MSYMIPMNRPGMLSQQGIGLPINAGRTPILNPSPNPRPAARPALQPQQTNATGNRRMSSRIPDQQIDMGTEGMMRIGGNVMGAASQGALPALSAGMQTYGDIMDYNRAGKMAEYEQQMLRDNEEAERQRLALKMQQDAAKDKQADPEALGELRIGMAKLQQAKEALSDSSNLTGVAPKDIWNRIVGKTVGNKEEAVRLFLNEIRLDSILRQVAKTKGAISNAEMALFGSQAPDVNAQEGVWLDWINRQMTMQQIMMDRLSTGERVDENAPLSETMPSIANSMPNSGSSGSSSFEVDPEIENIVNQYTN